MTFVPVTGTATFRAAEPPRDGVVEFTDERRTVALPIRAALPVLTKAHSRDDLHPSVGLLSGAALLGLRLVAAGQIEPAGSEPSWRMGPLAADDEDRVLRLAAARAHEGLAADEAEDVVRAVLDAVADAMPRAAPTVKRRPPVPRPHFEDRLRERLRRYAEPRPELPQLVRISLRVEADEEELVAGSVRLVLQVHDEQNPLHLCDAGVLWTADEREHGFGDRARTHAAIALRGAAEAWPALDRLLELRVPDQITLDGDELESLLAHGVAALATRGVDVLWPRSLGRELTASAVLDRSRPMSGREAQLRTGIFGEGELFSFRWQLAVHGDPLTDEEMDQLAASAAPLLRLRGNWTVIDPAIARKARKRVVRTATPAEAIAAALTGTVQFSPHEIGGSPRFAPSAHDSAGTPKNLGTAEQPVEEQVILGASLLRVRERLLHAAEQEPVDVPTGLHGTLRDYQRQGLTWLAELTSHGLGACLADDMGLGKTITLIALHLHRVEEGHRVRRSSCARPASWATGSRSSPGSRRASRSAGSTEAAGRSKG